MLKAPVRLEWLSTQSLNIYRPMAPSGLDEGIVLMGDLRQWQQPGFHALGVNLLGVPMGLLLLQTRGSRWKRSAETVSLAVGEPFRRQGLATRLIEQTIQSCALSGISSLSLSYPQGQAWEKAMARLCDPARGWVHMGETALYNCRIAEVPAFMESLRPLAERLESMKPVRCVPYRTLATTTVRSACRRLRPPDWATPPKPTGQTDGLGILDVQRSQALMLGNDLVGWCLCHRVSNTSHRITVAYVAANLQTRGYMVLPMMKTLGALLEADDGELQDQNHSIRFGIWRINQPMIRFAERRIKPFAQSITHTVDMSTRLSRMGNSRQDAWKTMTRKG